MNGLNINQAVKKGCLFNICVGIGGKNKKQHQIKEAKNTFIVKDNIELGVNNIIPLWLLGFLY